VKQLGIKVCHASILPSKRRPTLGTTAGVANGHAQSSASQLMAL
jgi:hypothetical protein